MIGFIGLGIMGENMARRMLESGQDLIIHNRTKDKATALLEKGAIWADSPAEVAQKADIVFTMLTTPSVVESVIYGEQGLLSGLSNNTLWVDTSTVKPAYSEKWAKDAKDQGGRFVDAPVAGSKGPAEQGKLHFLVGGKKQDIEEITPLLEVMGQSVQHMGDVGKGSATKLAVNLTLVQSMASFAEAVSFGESVGLDRAQLADLLLMLPTTAPVLDGKRDMIVHGTFETQFPLEHAYKDLQQLSETAYESGAPLPISHAAKELFAFAKQKGLGREDFAAVYLALKQDK
ncbi:3-hydroxyisobutyrate dehydrogenase-like beta-hydroxyacid dehydrogenase [Alkalicoccobacillus murimartini]|uniref:3-hydroxyisobutyrate dehydrogenase-like beta-hydroxyacid dehydrogenase n=2 Tax=Alkalicoccobacillus murimartini TaxID=171685 RepID=A0ABT9YJN3_9BACI|nr:3-hydroxyisobutyrate dehydrogenase-like beta-hydroxyacid dehydrogenase [Alkalicoccobacillus murimartini]